MNCHPSGSGDRHFDQRVVTTSSDGTVRLWDAASGQEIAILQGHEGAVASAAFSPDGALVVTASSDGTARLWDASTGHELVVLRHTAPVSFAGFSADGQRIITASGDRTIRLWNAETMQLSDVFRSPQDPASSILLSFIRPGGR